MRHGIQRREIGQHRTPDRKGLPGKRAFACSSATGYNTGETGVSYTKESLEQKFVLQRRSNVNARGLIESGGECAMSSRGYPKHKSATPRRGGRVVKASNGWASCFVSKYGGTCAGCGVKIPAGEYVTLDRSHKIVHPRCVSTTE